MSGTMSTGIAPGFGGFAVSPDGQAQYMNRRFNPYTFLQQPLDVSGPLTDTAPAANANYANGGLVALQPPPGLSAVARYMHLRSKPFAAGGTVPANMRHAEAWLRAHGNGGDTILAHINPREAAMLRAHGGSGTINPRTGLPQFGDGEGGNSGDGAGGGSNGNAGNGGTGSDGGGSGAGSGAGGVGGGTGDSGVGGGFGGGLGSIGNAPSSAPDAGFSTSGFMDSAAIGPADPGFGNPSEIGVGPPSGVFDSPGIEPGQALGYNNEDLGLAQIGLAGAFGAAKGALGPAGALASALGLNQSNIGNALGIGAMGKGASFGSSIGSAVGALGLGPVGAGIGAAVGAMAGAHGEMGGGALGGTGSTAGTSGAAGHGAASTNDSDGFGSNLGMDAAPSGSQTGLGGPTGNNDATYTADAKQPDITTLIERIKRALGGGETQAAAAGGRIMGRPRIGNHAFHQGSGLVHGTSDGREDALYTHVPPGGYVVPADVVSGLGEGNTLAGAKKLTQAMPQQTPPMASGGTVPVRLSAGEFYIHPRHVQALGGSGRLDGLVNHVRQQSVRQVSAMPPPR